MEQQFEFLASYTYSAEAQIFKGLLESNGIEVFVRDEFTTNSNPIFSNAIGGVKLFVRPESLEQARKLLGHVNPYSLDDSGQPVECPKCHEHHVDLVTSITEKKTFFAFIGVLLFGGLPLYVKHIYKCADCDFEFEQNAG